VRYLILSDIHANWQALEAVLGDCEGRYSEIVCCGDLVGYGADPNAVVSWARQSVAATVRGNHDKVCCGIDDPEWFNPVARSAALWTLSSLSPENAGYLRALPKGPKAVNGYSILHGSPADEDEYLIAPREVKEAQGLLPTVLSFFGHTHVQGGFLMVRQGVLRIPKTPPALEEQTLEFENDVRYLINPGSVGQPRDGDPRAAYVLYDSDERHLTYRRVRYDVAAAQARIRAEHLPDVLAERLAAGA
jgi:predicted phosphodiesterase